MRRRRVLLYAVGAVAALLVVGVGSVGVACKVAYSCGLRGTNPPPLSVREGDIALPEGFTARPVAEDLLQAAAFDFLPDGRILVAERAGLVKLVDEGGLAAEPVLDITRQVNVEKFRGLVALSVDPDFEDNGFFYVMYTVRKPGVDPDASTVVRLSRFVLRGQAAGDERVLIGSDGDGTTSCTRLPATADCLPSDVDHIGGDIAFADDGSLFVATGDGGGEEEVEATAFRALDVDSVAGKILHVTRDGEGLASNPFFDGDTAANRAKVWALGMRNPFRLALSPEREVPVVGDVGWNDADEIDLAPAGAHLGWPCFEGDERTTEYEDTEQCAALYAGGEALLQPLITLEHPDAASVTGGVFYEGDVYPDSYRGTYFYADWGAGWIRHVRIDDQAGRLDGEPETFAEDAGGPVAFRLGPDGLLYVLSLNYGKLYRIDYDGS